MTLEKKKLDVVLSGGGIRATIFHLGVLSRLAKSDDLDSIRRLSTVSGGSLSVALAMSLNDMKWPSSAEFIDKVLPKIKILLTTKNLEKRILFNILYRPWWWFNRGRALNHALKKHWSISCKLSDLPEYPLWYVNATNFYTGKNWRFCKDWMGDWQFGYIDQPDIALSSALASSAGFPYAIGKYKLRLPKSGWYKKSFVTNKKSTLDKPTESSVMLWDGGVYDNLGMEALYKIGRGLTDKDSDFLLVSDAGAPLVNRRKNIKNMIYFKGWKPKLSLNIRTVDIMSDQIKSLRSRFFINDIQKKILDGVYIKIGNSVDYILTSASKLPSGDLQYQMESTPLSSDVVATLAQYPTTLGRVTDTTFKLLIQHGYETADATLGIYYPGNYEFQPY